MRRPILIASLLWLAAPLAHAQDAGTAPAPAPTATPAPAPAAPAPAPLDTQAAPAPLDTQAAPASIEAQAAAPADVPMTNAELEAFGLDTNNAGVDTDLHVSGFADFTVSTAFVDKESAWRVTSVPPRTTGYIGNFNVYLKKNLTETLRTMGEVRLTYLPNGSADLITGLRTNTSAADYADYNRTLRWGGIEIERVYVEWSIHPLVALRIGQFLTPYGIWNVDHGSPTYVPVQRPFVIGNNWFPERQTGFELFGRWDASGASTIGYHLTLSNGTGPVSEYMDLDENKAIGGRIFWDHLKLGEFHLGASGYYGRDTGATWALSFTPGGALAAKETINSQYDAMALGADASWKYRGLLLQTEWIAFQRRYTEHGRTSTATAFGMPGTFPADSISWGMYALAGYRFKWLGVMPFMVIEHIDGEVFPGYYAKNVTYQAGLNIRPVDVLTLKIIYYHVKFLEGVSEDEPLRQMQAQIAWAF
jgi:hypothetical protein